MPNPFVGGTEFGWVVPIPRNAEVRIATDEALAYLDKQVGYSSANKLLEKSGDNKYFLYGIRQPLTEWNIFKTLKDKVTWADEHRMSMGERELEKSHRIVKEYFDDGYDMFAGVVPVKSIHPGLRTRVDAACSVVYQRAALLFDYETAEETIILQSQFHAQGCVNVVTDPLRISFSSGHIWYPMRLSTTGNEEYGYLTLDVLVRGGDFEVPRGFSATHRCKVRFEGRNYALTRLEATMRFEDMKEDLRMRVNPHAPRKDAHGREHD